MVISTLTLDRVEARWRKWSGKSTELNQLEHLFGQVKAPPVTTRGRILLKTDAGWSAPQVAQALDVAEGTVFRIKRRFAEEGLAGVLQDRPQDRYWTTGAKPTSSPCTPAPAGHDHWTGKVVELGLAPSLSHETVRLQKKTSLTQEWCIPQ